MRLFSPLHAFSSWFNPTFSKSLQWRTIRKIVLFCYNHQQHGMRDVFRLLFRREWVCLKEFLSILKTVFKSGQGGDFKIEFNGLERLKSIYRKQKDKLRHMKIFNYRNQYQKQAEFWCLLRIISIQSLYYLNLF